METFRLNTFFLLINYFLSDCTQIVFLTELLKRFHKDAVPRHHYYYHFSATYLSKNIFIGRKGKNETNEWISKEMHSIGIGTDLAQCSFLNASAFIINERMANLNKRILTLKADVSASSLHHSQGKVSK